MKRIRVNFIYKLIFQIASVLVPLILTPYLTRTLGATELGNYGFTYSLMTYFSLFAVFGFNIYGRREIAKVRDDKKETSKVFFEIMIAKTIPAVIAIGLFIGLLVIYTEYRLLLISLSPLLIYHIFDITFLVQGDENFKYITIRDLGIKLTSIVLIFIFVKKPEDVWIYAIIISLATLLSAFAMLPYLIKRIQRVKAKELKVFHHFKGSAYFLVPAFAASVFLYIDKIMIKFITGSSEQVAFYEESIKIVTMLAGLMTSLANVLEPRNANEFAKGNIDGVKENTVRGINYTILFCLPMAIGLISIAPIFCPFFFGPGFDDVIPILMIMSILIPAISLNEMIGTTYLIATGRERQYSRIILICALFNIALNFGFIYLFGVIGAAISTVVSELAKTIIMFIYLRKEIRIKDLGDKMIKKLIACLVMCAFIIPSSIIANRSLFALAMLVISGIILFVAFEYVLKDDEFMEMLTYCGDLFKRMRRKKNE